ncbi:hypothetical protein JJB07_01545 [Tumebacillus sp. ITR2]|uniref:PepSY domain-containing protein n=1 Tax=Tumebacillus amylolyticus TaxID=2801339 RepID=A0ABS1J4V9_9BACL|nr:PepSY domain-containing protein [Tumebacillus amylolyticus]MBL0385317.1 hypothetical protein [Tumebacillus amylolyticus]
MKTKYIAVTAVAILLGSLAWFSDHTQLERQALATDGITLDVPDHDPQIAQSDAIASARSAYGDLISKETDVHVEYCLVSNTHLTSAKVNRRLERTPAYIVRFTRTTPSTGPSVRVVHVIVDASSGEALQAYSNQ